MSNSSSVVRLLGDHPDKEDAMKFMLLIYQGDALEKYDAMTPEEKQEFGAGYQAINQTPGVTPGTQMQAPDKATTVRVQNGKRLTTDGPFAETKEAVGGYCFFEADDLDAAIELAAKIPSAQHGGAVEIRQIVDSWS